MDVKCGTCDRPPVKSRRNTTCRTCGAIVCIRCQHRHFAEQHEEDDEFLMREIGVIA